ncbi:MAG: hypothetical protein KC535_04450 [Nanoarchaeota archaeon]|nr:hypothetical protein [Nanoarchaeota archaeon]
MIKLKGLKPSLREKKRYIVYQVNSKDSISMKSFQDELIKKVTQLLGVFTPAGLLPVKFDDKKKRGIIRVNHTAVDLVRSSFVLIDKIGPSEVTLSTLGVSGILRKAKEYLSS